MSTLWKVSTRNLWLAYRVGMTIRRGRGWAAIGALAVALTTLSGCGTDTPVEIPTQQPTSTPIFASDEEALAGAQSAYAAYQNAVDEILMDGGAQPERLREYVTPALYDQEAVGFEQIAADGFHQVGRTFFDSLQLQSYDPSAQDGVAGLVVYLCSDVSETDIKDSAGKSVVPEGGTDRTPFQVTFDMVDARYLPATRTVWTGANFCV